VEARDEGGGGRASTVPLIISLSDVNDHAPRFEFPTYDLYLAPDNNNFSTRVFLKVSFCCLIDVIFYIKYKIIYRLQTQMLSHQTTKFATR